MEIRLALDAMGGDDAPGVPVRAAVESRGRTDRILLVGDRAEVEPLLAAGERSHISVVHTPGRIGMEDKLSLSMLRDRDNSLRKSLSLVKQGEADVALSAGNTAAFVSMAIAELGLLPGVDRPAIAVVMPTVAGRLSVFLDVGANASPKAAHFLQYGIMGAEYARVILGVAAPRTALLNIGEEPAKGDDLRREAFGLLQANIPGFIGNIEGQDLFSGTADVVVTDAFTGNVVLKVTEGLTRSVKTILRTELTSSLLGKAGCLLLKPGFAAFARKVDYAEYGGGMLLGVAAPVVISHGRSSVKAILGAVRLADAAVRTGLVNAMAARLRIP